MINSLWPFTIRPFQRLYSVVKLGELEVLTSFVLMKQIYLPHSRATQSYYLWATPQRNPQAAMLACLVSTLCKGNNLYQVLPRPQDQISSTQKGAKLDKMFVKEI